MRNSFSASSWRLAILAGAALLSGCASYDGRGLQPGVSSADDVVALMGTPAMQWQDADGRRQLAYPRGPEGLQTYMAFIDTQGRLERIEGVLDTKHFARIEPGKSDQAAILRLTDDRAFAEQCREHIRKFRGQYTWSHVMQPLEAFCAAPHRAQQPSAVRRRLALLHFYLTTGALLIRHKGYRKILAKLKHLANIG